MRLDQAYNLDSLQPVAEWTCIYGEVKAELKEIGLALQLRQRSPYFFEILRFSRKTNHFPSSKAVKVTAATPENNIVEPNSS